MASFNQISIVGYLGRDPELKHTPVGDAVCSFSLATTKRKKKGDDNEEKTTWFRCTLWRRQAELAAEYLAKGSQVWVSGELETNEYTDRDGNHRTSVDVSVSNIQFLSKTAEKEGRPEDTNTPRPSKAQLTKASANKEADADSDIPF